MDLEHISLFTGIGGIDLAAEWAGFETILMVENNAYCQKVLNKHWPDVPILEDIFDVTKETIQEAMANAFGRGEQQSERDIAKGRGRTSDSGEEEALAHAESRESGQSKTRNRGQDTSRGSEKGSTDRTNRYQPITLVTGGFPCQPVSQAGKRRGKEDDRYLWPEMLRVIKEVRPRWVVAENVAGLITMGLNDCLSDLEGEGYITETFLIPACAVNAPHRRDRIFIVGYSSRKGLEGEVPESQLSRSEQSTRRCSRETDVADTNRNGLQDRIRGYGSGQSQVRTPQGRPIEGCGESWWAVEPEVGRVAYGIPSRVDRIRCLGNAVVPQQIYPVLQAIADIEVSVTKE